MSAGTPKTLSAKILVHLHQNPGAALKDLLAAHGASARAIRTAIYRLKSNGYIERAGSGYVLTSKGEWFVKNVLMKGAIKERAEMGEPGSEASAERELPLDRPPAELGDSTLRASVSELASRVEALEREVESMRSVLGRVVREVKVLKKSVEEISRSISRSAEERQALPKPVMDVREALSTIGSQLERLRLEGKVEVVGSLVVDKGFYESFKKKFPMSASDLERLTDLERMLLSEMVRDARVIVRAGKEYRLIA